MKKHLCRTFLSWLPFAVAITLVCGLLYAAVQQDIRQSANDPQIQAAEDAAQALDAGADPQSIVPQYQTDISKTLSPYIILYAVTNASSSNPNATSGGALPILGSGVLPDGSIPTLPAGVFSYTQSHGEDRFTWQPQTGIRSAVVVDRIQNGSGTIMGYVLVGRSLTEVEKRENNLMNMVAAGWLVTLAATFMALWISRRCRKPQTVESSSSPSSTS